MLSDRILKFNEDIYRKYYHELMKDYANIIEGFSKLIEEKFKEHPEIIHMKDELIEHSAKKEIMTDLVKMNDFLSRELYMIVVDAEEYAQNKEN